MKFESIQVAIFSEEDEKHFLGISKKLDEISDWTKEDIERVTKEYATEHELNYKDLTVMLQVALTYRRYHIGYKNVIYYLGKNESRERLMFLWDKLISI